MQKIILALACVVQGTAAASSCPLPGAETAEVVCNKLEGTYFDTEDNTLAFTGVWDPLAVSCGQCDWMNMDACSTPLACEAVVPKSDDEGFSVWFAGNNECKRCSKLYLTGCNSTETCTSEINYNDDPDVMSFGSWSNVSNTCTRCAWDSVDGCKTAEDCACVSQRPGKDDDGTTVWDKLTGCRKCSSSDFGACGTATKIFNQVKCPDKFKAKKQAKENDWSCSNVYKLTGTNKEKEPHISWVYAVAAWALGLTLLNTCFCMCMGIKIFTLSGGSAKGTTSNPVQASVLEKAAASEPEVGYANYEKKGNNV